MLKGNPPKRCKNEMKMNDCVPILFCVQTGTQSLRRHVFHLPVQTGTEWNDCVLFHFFYHFCNRSIFWNGTILFEAFPSELNPSASHFSEQYGTKWNGYVPVCTGSEHTGGEIRSRSHMNTVVTLRSVLAQKVER